MNLESMIEIGKSFLVGGILGAVFFFFRLPLPAPENVAGIMGIIGVFVGFVLMRRLMN